MRSRSPLLWIVALAAAISIFWQVCQRVAMPMDRDEKDVAAAIHDASFQQALFPLQSLKVFPANLNQNVALVGSWLSTRGGVTPERMRVPSLIFTLLTLGLLLWRTHRWEWLSLVFVFFPLAANSLFLWLMASSKGYSSLVFFSLAFLFLAEQEIRSPARWRQALLTLTGALLCLSHTVGSLFYLLALASAWPTYRLALAIPIPLATLSLAVHLFYLEWVGDLFVSAPAPASHALTVWLGLTRATWAIPIVALSALLLTKVARSPLARLLGLSAVVLLWAVWGMKTRVLHARYFLVFLIPCLLLLAEGVKRSPRLLGVSALLAFTLLPLASSAHLQQSLIFQHRAFENLVSAARKLARTTPQACFEITGERRQKKWLEKIYLRDYVVGGSNTDCQTNLRIHLARDAFDRPHSVLTRHEPSGPMLWSAQGRTISPLPQAFSPNTETSTAGTPVSLAPLRNPSRPSVASFE